MTSIPITCRCSFCSGEIEFEQQRAGDTVTCPHCAMDTQLYIPGGPKPAPPSQSSEDSGERFFYQDGNVSVTNLRFVVGSKTYAMSGITSVELAQPPVRVIGALVMVCIGLMLAFSQEVVLKAMGWPMFILSLIVLIQRSMPKYSVNVTTSAGETTALESRKSKEIKEIVAALNRAILSRG